MQGKCKEWLKHSRRPEMGRNDVASNWRFVVRSAASPFGNYDPSNEMFWYGRCEHQNLCQTLPNFFHAIVRARHSDTMIFVIFRTLYAFPEIKIPTRPMPLAPPCGQTVWSFFPFLAQCMKTRKATPKWYCANTHVYLRLYIYIQTRSLFLHIQSLRLLARPAAW